MSTDKTRDELTPFDYNEIDTSMIEKYNDKQLLSLMKGMNFIGVPGWGLIAEVCKRYQRLIKE